MELMDVDDVRGQVMINLFIVFVENNEEKIKVRYDRSGYVDVGVERCFVVVLIFNRVGGSENRGVSIEGGLDIGFGDGNCLLFYCFVDGDLVGNIYFVKFVNVVDVVVCKYQSVGFDGEFFSFFIFDYCGCEIGGGGGFVRSVDCLWSKVIDVF